MALQRVEQSSVFVNIMITGNDNDLAMLNKTLKLQHTLTGATLGQLVRNTNEAEIKTALDMTIIKACTKLNLKHNLQDHQIQSMVNEMLRVYKHETIEDIIMCFNKGVSGAFNENGIIYTVDISVVRMWMEKHLSEKADLREQLNHENKYPKGNSEGVLGLIATKKKELGFEDEQKREADMKAKVSAYPMNQEKQREINKKTDEQIEYGRKKEIERKKPK